MLSLLLTLLYALLGLTMSGPLRAAANPSSVKADVAAQARLAKRYGDLPLSFEANQGQADPQAKFLARGHGYVMFFRPDGLVLELTHPIPTKPGVRTTALGVKLVRANPAPRVSGVEPMPGKSNYFIGSDPSRWRTNIPTYAKVHYADVYPGVELVFYGNERQLEYDFVLSPHADPRRLGLRIEGASRIAVDAQGNLVIETASGRVRFHKPVVYQPSQNFEPRNSNHESQTSKRSLVGRYVLQGNHEIGFEVAAYDPRRPLVIDPVLSYSTYLGGNGGDVGQGIAVDASGNAYVTGSTASLNFPTIAPFQKSNGGGSDIFVAKLNSAGSALIYSTYLGGSGDDSGTTIAVDSSGNAYVSGSTASTNFPTTSGAFQTKYGGNGDAFVTALNATGSALVYSSYLGGSGADFAQGIAVDSSGSAYVTGSTASLNFPTTAPLQKSNGGDSDAFVAKVNSSGSALVYSTYLGGSGADSGQGITVDASGNAYVAGFTASTNFPLASNPFQSASGGSTDAFVAKLNAAGSALLYSTYLGGSGSDRALAIALDSSGDAYVAGDTASLNFPTTAGAFQAANNGNTDAFVSKLNPAGSALVYSTFLGGSDLDSATGIAVDASGNAYVTGLTQSTNFPTHRPSQTSLGGGACGTSACPDAFVTELNAQGASLVYSTYLGGSGADSGQGIALDSSGTAYVTGTTASPNFALIAGAFQGVYGGVGTSGNAFAAKINPGDAPGLSLNPQTINFGNQGLGVTSAAQPVAVTNAGSAALSISSVTATGDFAQTNTCGALAPGGTTCTISVNFTPAVLGARAGDITITDNAAGSPHHIALTGTGVTPAPSVTLTPTSLTFPDLTVGATSQPQTVTLTNNGQASLSITSIAASGDYTQTNDCGSSVKPGASCTITVVFKPTQTGSRAASITITDNATPATQTVSLSGNGIAVFTLSSATPSSTILIGTASATFTVNASAPSSFTSSITLSCESGATCAFSPSSITPGQSSTVTVSGLSATSSNPTNLTVDGSVGTSGSAGAQTAKLPLSVFFQDFSVSATPVLNTVTAGQSTTYTISVTPVNGFNQSVTLSCPTSPFPLPTGVTCSFNPSSLTPSGSAAVTSTLTVKTTARSVATPRSRRGPNFPVGGQPVGPWLLLVWAAAVLALCAEWAARRRRRGSLGAGLPPGAPTWRLSRVRPSLAVLVVTVLLAAIWTGCGSSTAGLSGTQGGNYPITITGTLGSNSAVVRAVAVNLSVG